MGNTQSNNSNNTANDVKKIADQATSPLGAVAAASTTSAGSTPAPMTRFTEKLYESYRNIINQKAIYANPHRVERLGDEKAKLNKAIDELPAAYDANFKKALHEQNDKLYNAVLERWENLEAVQNKGLRLKA